MLQPLLQGLLLDIRSHMLKDDSSFVIFIVQYDELLACHVRPYDYFPIVKEMDFICQYSVIGLQVSYVDRTISLILLKILSLLRLL